MAVAISSMRSLLELDMELRETPEPVGQRLRMPPTARHSMIRRMAASRILIGYDGSPHAEDALALGRVMSAATGAELVLARVVPLDPLALTAVPMPELRARYEERSVLPSRIFSDRPTRPVVAPRPGPAPRRRVSSWPAELDPGCRRRVLPPRAVGQVLAGNVALRLLNGLDRPLAVAPAGYAARGPGRDDRRRLRRVARGAGRCKRRGASLAPWAWRSGD